MQLKKELYSSFKANQNVTKETTRTEMIWRPDYSYRLKDRKPDVWDSQETTQVDAICEYRTIACQFDQWLWCILTREMWQTNKYSLMVRRSSSVWLMCGNLSISRHFLLLPLRLPPPPSRKNNKADQIGRSCQQSYLLCYHHSRKLQASTVTSTNVNHRHACRKACITTRHWSDAPRRHSLFLT